MAKRLLVIATALATASCSSLQAFETREFGSDGVLPSAPSSWSAGNGDAGAELARDWVASMQDERLAALIDEAFDGNPSLAQSLARYHGAVAAARIDGARYLPSLDGSLGYQRTQPNVGSGSDSFGLDLSASWETDLWGALRDNARASGLNAEAAAEDVRASQLSVAGLVAKGWFSLIEARLQTELAERDVATRQNSLNLTERRFARGLVRSSDVRTARSALASSQAALASRQRSEAASARSLETLLGRYPSATLTPEHDFPEFGAIGGLGTPIDMLNRRPDVRAAENRLSAAGFQADAAAKALIPSLSLRGSSGTGGVDVSDMFDLDTLVSSITASLVAPIFDGGRLIAQRDQVYATAEGLVASYIATVLTAWQESENAIHADAILAQRVENLQQAYEEAAAAEDLVVREYSRGVSTIFELLTAQSRRISAESQYISARRERATNRVDLYLALAGDFSAAQSADPAAHTGE
ncbi:efflux transporter outer membrane subunit [uncultured Maricaulis sp.]|uniref:efflux transporter outer membrane subunit n=1 Tax=uncultured Maricaulis sp. TaxID=174710 RepID=UPI002628CB6F|nr:efflux transporter outer membrane subunit [uncultured Maricaulis sp.]